MVLILGMLGHGYAQNISTGNPAFDDELDQLLSRSVKLTSVLILESKMKNTNVRIFDARENVEYEISHIPGALNIGYENFDPSILYEVKKDETIVLYCSVGYRSEKIGEQLQDLGYTNVFNLYGSIFEWANKGLPLENSNGKKVSTVHTYNQDWSKWVDNPNIEKVW